MKIDNDKNLVHFLIQYGDKLISDPAFWNPDTDSTRLAEKTEEEMGAFSAHLSISLEPTVQRGSEHIALLEQVPGISVSRIEAFFKYLFKTSASMVFDDDYGKSKQGRIIPILLGHASQGLIDELERGKLRNIELVSRSYKENDFDEFGYTTEISRAILLKAAPKKSEENPIFNLLNAVKKKANESGYQEMRLRYHRFEGKDISLSVNTAKKEALDTLFTRCEIVRFSESLPQCLNSLNENMIAKIAAFMEDAKMKLKNS